MTESGSSQYELGLAALDNSDYDDAVDFFTDAIADDEDAWEPLYARAYAVVMDEDLCKDEDFLVQAAADLEKAFKLNSTSSDVALLRGTLAMIRSEPEEAVRYFLIAVGRSPQRDAAAAGLAEALHGLLGAVEAGQGAATADVELCDRLDEMIVAARLPSAMRDGLRAEIVAARAYRRQLAGENDQALADLQLLAGLMPGHRRLPTALPAATVSSSGNASAASSPTFDAVGGVDGTTGFAGELRKMFDIYLGDPDIQETRRRLAQFGQPATRSILMFGPSGCGKTYIVRAFAGEYRRRHGRELPLVRLRLEEIFGKYIGESESRLAEAFDRAIEAQPSLLFCDEIDGLGMSRETITHDFRQEFTGHLLQQVDRLKEQDAALLFFGCTNRVWQVDLALLRRFDRLIPVDLPDEPTREAIFRIHLGRIADRLRADDLELPALARDSHGLTPGDIQKVVSRAVDDLLVTAGPDSAVLTQEMLATALEKEKGKQGPMHLAEWVRSSRTALNKIGQEEMAAELDRMYGPYISTAAAGAQTNGYMNMPLGAWTEDPEFDLGYLRRLRW